MTVFSKMGSTAPSHPPSCVISSIIVPGHISVVRMMFTAQFFERCPFPHFIDITGETRSRRYRGSWAHLQEEARLSLGLGGKGQVEIRRGAWL